MWSPCTHSTNLNGPVPTGLRAGSPLSIAFLLTIWPLVARFVEERAERRLEMEDGNGRIGRVDRLDLRIEAGIGAGRLRVEDALEAVLHIGRGEVLAIVEGGVGDEVELPGLVVDLLPRGREVGHEIAGAVKIDELAEDVLIDLGAGVDRRDCRIEQVRLAGQRGAQRAAVLDGLRHRRAAGEGHDEAERERGESAEDGPALARVIEVVRLGLHEVPPVTAVSVVGSDTADEIEKGCIERVGRFPQARMPAWNGLPFGAGNGLLELLARAARE